MLRKSAAISSEVIRAEGTRGRGDAVDRDTAGSDGTIRLSTCLIAGAAVCIVAYFLAEVTFTLKARIGSPDYMPVLVVFPVMLVGLGFVIVRLFGVEAKGLDAKVFFASALVGLSTFTTAVFVVGLLPSLYYYATPENDMELIWPGVPAHLVPFQPDGAPEKPEAGMDEEEWKREWERRERARMELFYRGLPKYGDEVTWKKKVPWYNASLPDEGVDPESGDLRAVLDEPFEGATYMGRRVPARQEGRKAVWESWLRPFGWWMLFFALVYGVQFCMAGILRKQWVEHEQLMFPHAVAAAEATCPPKKGLLRSHYFWMGAGICGALYAFEGLHHYFPAFPRIELFGSPLHNLSLSEVFSQHPWNAIKSTLSIQPFIICIAFLLPAELSFSVWVFALLDNLIRLVTAYARLPRTWNDAINFYWINSGADQTGAIIVLVCFLIWMSRRHLGQIFRRAFYDDNEAADRDEFIPYRLCLLGFVGGTLGILAWCVYAGMSLLISLFLFVVFYLILIYTSRLVSELGLLSASAKYFTPHFLFVKLFGYNNQTMLNTFAVNNFIWSPLIYTGTHTCPLVLTGFKLTGEATGGRRRFALCLFILTVLTAGIFFWGAVKYAYVHGALNTEREHFYSSTKWIYENTCLRDIVFKDRSHAPDGTDITAMCIGGGVMTFLLVMRSLFYWWPLHPLGYVAMWIDGIWFSFFIAWFVKRTILKYGGGRALPKASEFFYGLFAGQFFMAGFWFVTGALKGDASFAFM